MKVLASVQMNKNLNTKMHLFSLKQVFNGLNIETMGNYKREIITKQAVNKELQCHSEDLDFKNDSPEYALLRYE